MASMNEAGHRALVERALGCLTGQSRNLWERCRDGALEACMWPDAYAVRWFQGKTGPWREYLWPVKPFNNFLLSGRRLDVLAPPAGFYARKVAACLRRGDWVEAGRYAGVFSHYLADFAQPGHYYELDVPRLLPAPVHMANCNLHPMTDALAGRPERFRHRPQVLGASPRELEFYFWSRLAELHRQVLAAIVPMVSAVYRRRVDRATRITDRVQAGAAALFADFCLTCGWIAAGELPEAAIEHLAVCDLRHVEPHRFDVEYNFGHRPLVDVITLGPFGRPQPLRLRVGGGAARAIRGICTIPHALPVPGVNLSAEMEYRLPSRTFRTFQATVGLLADVPRQAPCRLEVWADGRAAFRSPMLTPQDAARVVRVNVERCRRLRLRAVTDGSTDKLAYAVWGFPRLLRGPFDA